MFPVTDFNFVVAGIATFAATVGYTASRRLSNRFSRPSPEDLRDDITHDSGLVEKSSSQTAVEEDASPLIMPPLPADISTIPAVPDVTTSPLARRDSLKRKAPDDGFDEPEPDAMDQELGYPHNLANLYPNKRSKTPTTESNDGNTVGNATPAASLDSTVAQMPDEDIVIPVVSDDPQPILSPAPEPPMTPSPVIEQPNPVDPFPVTQVPEVPKVVSDLREQTPALPSPVILAATPGPITRPTTPRPMAAPFASPSGGFAAFAGSTSPFASVSKPQTSPFTPSRSIWAPVQPTFNKDDDKVSALDAFKPNGSSDAFEKPKPKEVLAEKCVRITGEEGEDVELELKGVKLFIKRGSKHYTDGMLGHVKLLSNRTTLDERILFRREPLWKVSMNVRVNSYARCTFVPEENILKIILKEPITSSTTGDSVTDKDGPKEVVVYALKPGRSCSKQDFREFAETLSSSSHFKGAKDESTSS